MIPIHVWMQMEKTFLLQYGFLWLKLANVPLRC
jgi:hypothetical protein